MIAGFYPNTFVYSTFLPKIQFLQCFLSSMAQWGGPMVDTKQKMSEIQVCRYLKNAFFLNFSRNFRVCTYIQDFFMCACRYLNQKLKEQANRIKNCSRGFPKQKRKKKHMKRLIFITQFKIEFLRPFTGYRKVLGQMAGQQNVLSINYSVSVISTL